MADVLFQIIINPIYILIEILYNFFLKACHFNQFFSIIALSIAVNFIWLPLYLCADKLKIENDEKEKKLKLRIDSIKKNFKGEERHLLLKTYYKQNNYHPIFAFKGILSLALQGVFFIGAYLFFIKNIPSAPDGLLNAGNIKINLLPCLMTLISICSGYFYIKEHNTKKAQIYILPLLFLIILYNAPWTLVLYWIINNIFSLVKNILMTEKARKHFEKNNYFSKIKNKLSVLEKYNSDKTNLKTCYFLTLVCLWLLVGFLAPWNLIASAPVKFFYIYPFKTPYPILFNNLITTFGIFIFWGSVIYIFTLKQYRNKLCCVITVLFYCFLVNFLTIEYPYGEVTNALEFSFFAGNKILPFSYYLIFLSVICAVIYLLFKKRNILKNTLIIFILVSFITGIYDYREIQTEGRNIPSQAEDFEPVFNFSKNHKNVLILFTDMAISSYFPVILEEFPYLKECFEGFTYYPNSVSFATFTRLAYPSLIAGYEYTPVQLDKRKDSMYKKYNESLMVLPKLFQNNNFKVTLTDAPWGGFRYITSKNIFLKEGVNYDNIIGKYSNLYKKIYNQTGKKDLENLKLLERNMFYFALMKISPVYFRDFIIDNNAYLDLKKTEIKYTNDLLGNYSTMYFLDKLTRFEQQAPTFTIINSELSHNADCYLTYPSYELKFNPSKGSPLKLDRYSEIHYHSNVAAIKMLAKYLEFLKKQGIYDNTRIIIVSDHGARQLKNPNLKKDAQENVVKFNNLLIVKDFNQKGKLKISNKFMTTADVPYLATKNVIDNPINPFTGKLLQEGKKEHPLMVARTKRFRLKDRSETPFSKETTCASVKENIFEGKNWEKIKPYQLKELIKKDNDFE